MLSALAILALAVQSPSEPSPGRDGDLELRALDDIERQVVATERGKQSVRFALTPVYSYWPGLCETKLIEITYPRNSRPDISVTSAYRVAGDVNYSYKNSINEKKIGRVTEEKCQAEKDFFVYFEAPDATTASLAARLIGRIAEYSRNGSIGLLKMKCAETNCEQYKSRFAALSPANIHKVVARTCPGQLSHAFCFSVSVYESGIKEIPGARSVQRDGWVFDARVSDTMIGGDVVTYNEFDVDLLEVSLSGTSGLYEYLRVPGDPIIWPIP